MARGEGAASPSAEALTAWNAQSLKQWTGADILPFIAGSLSDGFRDGGFHLFNASLNYVSRILFPVFAVE